MINSVSTSLSLILLFGATSLLAQTVTFQTIPGTEFALDMSPDGRYIVGDLAGSSAPYLYDCQTETMTPLPAPGVDAVAVSDDGSVVLGCVDENGTGLGTTAAIWRQSTNQWESLGFLPNALNCPSRSSGYELSADGSVATGLSWDGCSGRGFVWTQATGMLELQVLGDGGNRSSALSADGTLFGGFARGGASRTPVLWRADQSGELLDPPDGNVGGEIYAFSDDGSIMLGDWSGDASKWSFNGMSWDRETIGAGSVLPSFTGLPTDIADDGTIVGFEINIGFRRSFIQYRGQGELMNLATWATARGAKIPGEFANLEACTRISADGTKIIGHNLFVGGWMLTIDVLRGDVNGDGIVNLLDVDPFVQLLTAGDYLAEADINEDGVVNLLDVDPFVALLSGN